MPVCLATYHRVVRYHDIVVRIWGHRYSAVGIATGYGLDGPWVDCRWGRDFIAPRPDRAWGLPSLLYNGFLFFSWGKLAAAWLSPPTSSSVEVFAAYSSVNFTLSFGSEEVLTSFVLCCFEVLLRCMRPWIVWDAARRRSVAAYRRIGTVC